MALRAKASVIRARSSIELDLNDSPRLRRDVVAMVQSETRRTRRDVAKTLALYGERPRVEIDSLTFTEAQVLGGWLPGDDA
jgi:hypothetical protein